MYHFFTVKRDTELKFLAQLNFFATRKFYFWHEKWKQFSLEYILIYVDGQANFVL